jgi:hypothetical protein
VTTGKLSWDLTPAERAQLERDCRESGVPVAVKDPATIKKVVGLLAKSGDPRWAEVGGG